MPSTPASNDFSAGLRLTEPIRREPLLAQMSQAINGDSPARVIFLKGRGGNGKTQLLIQGLEIARASGHRAAQHLVDLYDHRTFSTSGLMEAIVQAFPSEPDLFPNYRRERSRELEMALKGQINEVGPRRDKTQQAFDEDLGALALNQTVVLGLDTAEQLVYGGSQAPSTIAGLWKTWNWLRDRLLKWQSVIVLMAGRENECQPLLQELREILSNQFIEISVGTFSPQETDAYIQAVAEIAVSQGKARTANFLKSLSGESDLDPKLARNIRGQIFNCSGGQPIWLGLLMDYLDKAAGDGDKFQELLAIGEQAERTSADTALIEAELVRRIQQEWTGVKDTLLAMGLLQRGTTPELLAALLEETEEQARLRLAEIEGLSFVKKRPDDPRTYMHDEMYLILRRQVYELDPVSKGNNLEMIGTFHNRAIERVAEELNGLYAQVQIRPDQNSPQTGLNLNLLEEKHAERQQWLLDKLFYRFRENPSAGWQLYYRYARDAALSGDASFDIQLQGEVFAFLSEMDPTNTKEIVAGLSRKLVLATMLVQGIVRAWIERRYDDAIVEAKTVQQREADLIRDVAPSTAAIITIWACIARSDKGGGANLEQAYKELSDVIEILRPKLPNPARVNKTNPLAFRTAAVLAFAYRARGYNERIRGFLREAVKDYEKALKLWKQLNVRVEEAQTQNDLGYALSELGEYRRARDYVESALRLRKWLGTAYPLALSLNTLGTIDLREGVFEPTTTPSLTALALFEALGQKRGEGLARTTLAELYRRYAIKIRTAHHQEAYDYLKRSYQEAQQAVAIFRELNERSRIVDALIELGCTCRDLVRLAGEFPALEIPRDMYLQESQEALQEAAALAGDAILYRKFDALINLAWLAYFANQDELVEQRIAAVDAIIPVAYRFRHAGAEPLDSEEQVNSLVWTQLGKLNILAGHHFFRKFQVTQKQFLYLQETANYYTLGLQYSIKFSPDYRDLRKAEIQIGENLDKLKPQERERVVEVVQQTCRYFGFEEARMFELLGE